MMINENIPVNVNIEYCGVCNFRHQCAELMKTITESYPDVNVKCTQGRRGSFEVQINDTLVHSKLSSLAFPDYIEVVNNVKNAKEGQPIVKVKEQPITDCVLQ